MPTHARSSNADANLKVYSSKKVSKQAYFPHRRKTVRVRTERERDTAEKKQMVFKPEKMKKNVVLDSDEEDAAIDLELEPDNDVEEGGVKAPQEDEMAEQLDSRTPGRRSRKRKSDTTRESLEQAQTPIQPASKRRRRSLPSKKKVRVAESEIKSEEFSSSPPESGQRATGDDRRRRQSTMTQLVDGRRPTPGSREPEFRPVKRGPRTSWGGRTIKKEKDNEQRTLTQMVPGLTALHYSSDESLEDHIQNAEEEDQQEQEGDDKEYNAAIAKRLAVQGLFRPDEGREGIVQSLPPSQIVPSVEAATDDDEDEYYPTQHIPSPSSKRKHLSRHAARNEKAKGVTTRPQKPVTHTSVKPRFGLLSTPQKRRVFEIPSSQSPPESPLSTHVTPQKIDRSPLRERSGNAIKGSDTQARRKRVAFQEPSQNPASPPPLRTFRSVIQDSEDEDADVIEENLPEDDQQSLPSSFHPILHGKDIGADTQATLAEIDRACANADEDASWLTRHSSEELGDLKVPSGVNDSSQELGPPRNELEPTREADSARHCPPSSSAYPSIKQEPSDNVQLSNIPISGASAFTQEQSTINEDITDIKTEFSGPVEQSHVTKPFGGRVGPLENLPSTPMAIKDESSDDEEPSQHMEPQLSIPGNPTTDLDGEPIQVPRSPTANVESQGSHSSKAEQQLRDEWLSYSQYHKFQPGPTSSMNVGQDQYSYNATPLPPRNPEPPQQSGHLSQATTVDYTQSNYQSTPKERIYQAVVCANTTPRKIPSSQPVISPNKPPPLFIPSSFPSPTKFRLEDWSSPVCAGGSGRRGSGHSISQFGESMEDLSIPLPPPLNDDD